MALQGRRSAGNAPRGRLIIERLKARSGAPLRYSKNAKFSRNDSCNGGPYE
jgi:hypothetical protein